MIKDRKAEFIKKSTTVHGSKYDYSKIEYTNAHTKVTIVCPIHGEFHQRPYCHSNSSHGCPRCGCSVKKTTNQFILEATGVHSNRYDYSKVSYVSTKTPVDIICQTHGVFKQSPQSHIRGRGCPKCAGNMPHNIDEFRIQNSKFWKKLC